MVDFIFVHGWGMNAQIWSQVAAGFPDDDIYCPELGFVGGIHAHDTCGKAVYVTHSLGTMWALKHHAPDMKALIVINGFTCFHPFTPERILRTMQKRLARNPAAQMHSFWDSCGLPEEMQNNLDGALNTDRLQGGLEWLIDWDMADALQALAVPILSLSGRDDLVLPHEKMQVQWAGFDLQTHGQGGHILPLSHPDWCVDKIKGFMREHVLEK